MRCERSSLVSVYAKRNGVSVCIKHFLMSGIINPHSSSLFVMKMALLLVHLVLICMPFSHYLTPISGPSPALPSPQHTSLSALTAASWSRAVYAFTLSSLCWLLARCLFLFLLSVFSYTVQHWGGPLHPLPIPVCSPCTLSPCFHSVSCITTLSFHSPFHSCVILGWIWSLWADKLKHFNCYIQLCS